MSKLEKNKKLAIRAAKELFYPEKVVFDLIKCESEDEIYRVMINARFENYPKNNKS